MVVVAVVSDPLRPVRRVCSNMGGVTELPDDGERSELVAGSLGDVDSMVLIDDSVGSCVLSRLVRGVPAVIVVSMVWLRERRVCCAAVCRAGTMEGPGRRWALVRCAHVAIASGPRVYWDWTVSVRIRYVSHTYLWKIGPEWRGVVVG